MPSAKSLLILLFAVIANLAVAQTKSIYVKTYKDGDTSAWFTWHKARLAEMKLPDIMNSKDSMLTRVIFDDKMVTLSTNDFKNYTASATYFLDKILSTKNGLVRKKKLVYHTFSLPAADAKAIADYFIHDSIAKIPPADSLGWSSGMDGYTYSFEYSTPTQYTFKNYWEPEMNGRKIPQAAHVYSFGCYVEDILVKDNYWAAYRKKLKPGTYSNGYWSMTVFWQSDRLY